jgi:hypothetical protein
VTLTASPTAGSITGWSGGGCSGTGGANHPQQQLDGNRAFRSRKPDGQSRGNGSGTVTSSPSGITWNDLHHSDDKGTAVTLTPAPSAGSTFAGWSGACVGTGTCAVTTNASTAVTAIFNLVPKPCVVPKVEGKTLRQAKRLIRAHACTLGAIKHATSQTIERT